jgi:putative hydrolase of the HAD superfamily
MILALDLDGVVLTGHAEGGRWDRYLARDLGIETAVLQEKFFRPYWRDIMLGRRDLYDVLEACWPELRCKVGPREFVDYWFRCDYTVDHALLTIVDSWRAKGGTCVLATNQEHHRARYVWDDGGLSKRFDEMFYSAALGVEKPQPAFFHAVTEKLGSDEIVFLDDAIANVEAAKSVGWYAHRYRDVDDLKKALPAA